METPFQQITIFGLGLVGGSWGLALKKQAYGGIRVGCDQPEVLDAARAAGAIDRAVKDPIAALNGADLVVLAPPVGGILDLLSRLRRGFSPRALVTDVGSTKVAICERAREVFKNGPLFLGGHPLAGKERSGLENAEAALFEGTVYSLVPQRSSDLDDPRAKALMRLITSFGARPFVTDALSHDRAVAYLSHLPQLLSTALAGLIGEEHSRGYLPLELAGAGLRDMTRLAASPYSVWRDICRTNTANIQEALDMYMQKLQSLRARLSDTSLQSEFTQAANLPEKLRDVEN